MDGIKWTTGQPVVSRFLWFGKVAGAKPVTVVEDSDDLIAFYIAPGTQFKRVGTRDSRHEYALALASREWALCDDVWRDFRTLVLTRPGLAHCILGFWPEAGGELITWYVNLEEPLRRSLLGWDGRDVFLDVVVRADGSWHWKDEDEFEHAQALGLLTPAEAGEIRAEGQRVVEAVESGDAWWLEWGSWSPDPSWALPQLPKGWDVVPDD